jgi:hypothetical protein
MIIPTGKPALSLSPSARLLTAEKNGQQNRTDE